MRGPLIIISGPSGGGKSTVIFRLLAACQKPLRLSVSVTTRPPRPGEDDGTHYHFWDTPRFEQAIRDGALLEYAIVHGIHYYGTPAEEVEPYRARGIGVLLDIDVQGAAQVRPKCPDAFSVFLHAPPEEYERRLRARGTEDEAWIARRMATARAETARVNEYDVEIINDVLDDTVEKLRRVVESRFPPDGL